MISVNYFLHIKLNIILKINKNFDHIFRKNKVGFKKHNSEKRCDAKRILLVIIKMSRII